MEIIKELSEMIEEEIEDAGKYAKCALHYKESRPALADVFYKLANEELGHMNALHGQVVAIIDEYKKKNGEPPEAMKMIYDILHDKHVANTAAVKGMLSLYK
jgi:ferritin